MGRGRKRNGICLCRKRVSICPCTFPEAMWAIPTHWVVLCVCVFVCTRVLLRFCLTQSVSSLQLPRWRIFLVQHAPRATTAGGPIVGVILPYTVAEILRYLLVPLLIIIIVLVCGVKLMFPACPKMVVLCEASIMVISFPSLLAVESACDKLSFHCGGHCPPCCRLCCHHSLAVAAELCTTQRASPAPQFYLYPSPQFCRHE